MGADGAVGGGSWMVEYGDGGAGIEGGWMGMSCGVDGMDGGDQEGCGGGGGSVEDW